MGLGFGMRSDYGAASFTLFSLGFHFHPENDPEPCDFRFGLMIGFVGIHLDIGIFTSHDD